MAGNTNGQITIVMDAAAGPLERALLRVQGRLKAFDASVSKSGKKMTGFQKINQRLGAMDKIVANLGGAFRGAAIGVAIFTAAVVGAGAIGATALAAIPLALAGIGIGFAAMDKRVREAFGGLREHVVSTMKELSKPLVEPLIRAAGRLREAFDVLAPSLGRIFEQVAPLIDQASKALVPFAAAIGPVLERAFANGVPVLQAFGRALTPIGQGLAGLLDTLGAGSPQLSAFVDQFGEALGQLLPALGRLIVALTPVGTLVLSAIVPALISLTDGLAGMAPQLQSVTQFFIDHSGAAKAVATTILGVVVALKAVRLAMTVATVATTLFGAATTVASTALRAASIATGAFALAQRAAAAACIGTRLGLLALAIQTTATSIATKAAAAAQWLLNAALLANPITLIIVAIVALVAAIVLFFTKTELGRKIFTAAMNGIKVIASTVINFVRDNWKKLGAILLAVATGPIGVMAALIIKNWGRIKDAAAGLKSAVVSAFRSVVDYIGGIPGRIKAFFSGAGSWLSSAGSNIVRGLVNGIKSMGGSIKSALLGLLPGPLKKFAGALGIASPSKLFAYFGRMTGLGYAEGLGKTQKSITKAVTGMTDGLRPGPLALPLAFADGKGKLSMADVNAYGSPRTTVVNVTVNAPVGSSPADIGREIQAYLDANARSGGRARR